MKAPIARKVAGKVEDREDFGIYNPLGKKYADIISAHLQLRRLSTEDFYEGRIAESGDRGKNYRLSLDKETAESILKNGEVAALVSFQVRTSGYVAVARLYKTKKGR
jgi:hypothetical protein